MKTQNVQHLTITQKENKSTLQTSERYGLTSIQNIKNWMVKFNKNLSICGAAAAAAIRN
jgi:hypothetical protein